MRETISGMVSVARAICSGRWTLRVSMSSKKARSYLALKSVMDFSARAALRRILSSTSVMFMTWCTAMLCSRMTRRRTSTWRKVRKLPIWP